MENKLSIASRWEKPITETFYKDADDITLIQLTVEGDKRAFEPLWDRYQQRIRARLLRFVKNPIDAEDLLQDAFLNAYSALPRFRGHSSFYTWLYRIATNIGITHSSTGRLPIASNEIEKSKMVAAGPEQGWLCNQSNDTARKVIDQLPHPLRDALTLNIYSGFDYQSISDVMNCPIGTVRSRISRARAAISSELLTGTIS
jgi:RNA polymerase sigma-70 factor (ECF subfamily)